MKLSITPHTRLLLGSAALSVLATVSAGLAGAQTPNQPPASTPQSGTSSSEDEEAEDRVVVTGTNIAGTAPVGSEPVVITADEASRTGLTNVADIVRRLPQVQMGVGDDVGFQGGSSQQGYNQGQVETINLRGLGAAATLVLVDGRRVVGAGAVSTLTEANQVPLSALSRLEILPDGASAMYGSDAVAGVVNYVLRRDYDGFEATVRMGNQSGGDEWGLNLLAGTVWEDLGGFGGGNLLLTYDHQDRDSFRAGEIARLRQDLRPIGGPDTRIDENTASVGFSPNIISQGGANTTIPRAGNYTYWGVPNGNGTGLTAANLSLNNPNLVDGSDYRDFTGEQVRDQVAAYFNQTLNENAELFATLSYTNRETTSEHPGPTVRLALAGTPYVVPGLPANQTVQYSTLKDGRVRTFSAESETIGAVLGVKFDLSNDWEGELYANFGRNEQCDSCVTGSINPAAFAAQVQAGNINPLSSVALTDAQAATVYGRADFRSRTTLDDFVAKFNGSLFELPAGTMKAAVGGEFRTESASNQNVSVTGVTNTSQVLSTYDQTKYSRDIGSVFAELNIPVVSDSMNVPLVQEFTLSAAARFDDYSDVGSTTNPRIGFTWDVIDQLSFFGSWGTSFRAPSVTDVNPNAVTSGTNFPYFNTNPLITNGASPGFPPFLPGSANFALMLGSNPDLEPEESENWSVGTRFEHEGLELGATLWNISYDGQIIFPGTITAFVSAPFSPAFAPPNYGGWGAFIIPVNNPSTCNNNDLSTADPVLQQYLASVNYDFVNAGGDFSSTSSLQNAFCQVNAIADSRITNVGSVEQRGVDFSARYSYTLGDVDLLASLGFSHQLKYDISARPGDPFVDQLGELMSGAGGFEWRGIAGVTAQWQGFDATVQGRYLGSINASNQVGANGLPPAPDKEIPAHLEFDLTLGYSADYDQAQFAGLKGWRAQVAVTNVLDDYPAIWFSDGSSLGTSSWSPKYGSPFGRTFTASITGRF
jgi:iron complex outermembrane receptor protein